MFPINELEFSNMFSTGNIIIYLFFSVGCGLLLYFSSIKFLLSLQQSGYHGKRYFKWLSSPETPYLSRLMLLCLLGFLFFLVLNTTFTPLFGETVGSYIGFISFALFTVLYIKTESSVNAKIPLKKTKRLVRLCVTFIILLMAIVFGLLVLFDFIAYKIDDIVVCILRYSLICGLPILTPYILFVAYLINEPMEEIIRRSFIQKTKNKLQKSKVLKIGITGSYGKTSVKEILKTLLSQKYRVLATPASYNTPMGICLATKNLDSTHDVFLVEMGARQKGDIKELVGIVNPSVAVLTGINNQHLETFKSEQTIIDTKNELVCGLPENGKAFFSSDSQPVVGLYNKFNGEKYIAGLNGKDNFVSATNIVLSDKGMTFDLLIKGEKPIPVSTVLLGKHSISNICLAVSVAYNIGMSVEEIALGINRLSSVGHRLELVRNNKKIVIIDDSYNSNVDGVNSAMEVLDLYKGRKIVLTPGLVELGKAENRANYEMGKTLSRHADIVIVIGKHNAEMLINGLLDGGMQRENVIFQRTLNRGNEYLNTIMKEGDIVLFENDLPDNYS